MKSEEFNRKIDALLSSLHVKERETVETILEYWRVRAIANALLRALYKAYGDNKQRTRRKAEAIQAGIDQEFSEALPSILRAARKKKPDEIDRQFRQLCYRLKPFIDLRGKRPRAEGNLKNPDWLLYWYDIYFQQLKQLPRMAGFRLSDLEKAFPHVQPEKLAELTRSPPSLVAENILAIMSGYSTETLRQKILPKARRMARQRLDLLHMP